MCGPCGNARQHILGSFHVCAQHVPPNTNALFHTSNTTAGSGQSFKAYVFARTEPLGAPQPLPPKAISAAPSPAPTALPRLRTRRAPRVTELLRERRTRQDTAAAAAAAKGNGSQGSKPSASHRKQDQHADDAHDANENVPPHAGAQRRTRKDVAAAQPQHASPSSPVSEPSSVKPAATTRRRAAQRASLDTRASVDLQSPMSGEVRSARSLQGAADTASKVLGGARACKQVRWGGCIGHVGGSPLFFFLCLAVECGCS